MYDARIYYTDLTAGRRDVYFYTSKAFDESTKLALIYVHKL